MSDNQQEWQDAYDYIEMQANMTAAKLAMLDAQATNTKYAILLERFNTYCDCLAVIGGLRGVNANRWKRIVERMRNSG